MERKPMEMLKGKASFFLLFTEEHGDETAFINCRGCAIFVFFPKDDNSYPCCNCRMTDLLEERRSGLKMKQSALQHIKKDEEFLD